MVFIDLRYIKKILKMKTFKNIFIPFKLINNQTIVFVILIEVLFALFIWWTSGGGLIPSPMKVAETLSKMMSNKTFYHNLISSAWLTLKGMFISIIISMILGYSSRIPAFRPVVKFVVKCRYLTLTGLIFLFTLLTKDGSQLKISLLIFGIVPFFVTGLMSVFDKIDNQEYELCKTLRMNSFETLWEVIIVGRLDQVFEVMRQNFAISWMMITMVEGLSMSEGGLGTMLIKANKYVDLSSVFSILVITLLLGIFFDFLIGTVRKWLFPYV
jgi:ABC-type nitrate/sulfonate/bicarbonate transport system permease component